MYEDVLRASCIQKRPDFGQLAVSRKTDPTNYRGGSRNSSRGVFWAGILRRGGGGVRVQVHGNFHILTSKKKKPGGVKTLNNPPPRIHH